MTRLVHSPHPLLPAANRQEYTLVVPENSTIQSVLNTLGIHIGDGFHPLFVQVNGTPVGKDEYNTTLVHADDLVTVRAGVAGGKGSNVLAAVLEIALAIAVVYLTAGGATSILGSITGSAWGASAMGAAIMIGGSLLIQHFLGPIAPVQPNATTPYYQISGSQNSARPNQPMPIVFGTVRMAPDIDCTPYTDYESGNQYLYQTFNFGISNFGSDYSGITDMRIGTTPITAYANVETQWGNSSGALTLFPGNVYTDTGPDLTFAEGAQQKTTSDVGCVAIGIDVTGSLFHVNNDGTLSNQSVVIQILYRVTGTTDWQDFFTGDGSIYNPPGYTASNITDPSNYTYYDVDSYNSCVTLTNSSQNPYNVSFYQQVPLGQYDVQITRLTQDYDDTYNYADLTWSALKSYEPDTADYTGQTRFAMKIEATGQLNGAIQQLNALVSAQCPVYDSNTQTWSTGPTSNPAWWYLWVARGGVDDTGRRMYGVGFGDGQIDIDGIIEWGEWCDANSLAFNYACAQQMTVSDALTMIARVGRGTPTYAKGVLGVVYDQEGLPVTQMFTMANIRQGSFQLTYISNQLAQEITVNFLNPDLDYQQDQVSCTVPGVTAPEYTVTLTIPGITSKTQAAQEAALQAAAQYYFRRSLVFETDIEGLVCSRGDVISISHDLTNWSYSGRLANVTGGSATTLILDREVTITADTQPYISVRHPDGTYEEAIEVSNSVGTTNTLTLATPLSINPYTDEDNQAQDYIYSFDPAATPGRKMKVLAVEPLDTIGNQVRLTCREENDAYYAAATDPTYIYNPPTLLNQNPASITNITVSENTVPGVPGTTVTISWTMQQAAYASLQVQVGSNPWVNYGNQYQTSFTFSVATPSVLNIVLTPYSLAQVGMTSTPATYTYDMEGLSEIPPEDVAAVLPVVNGLQIVGDPSTSEFTGQDAKFQWRIGSSSAPEVGSEPYGGDSGNLNTYFLDYQVQISNTDGTIRRTDYTQDTNYTYTYEMNLEDGNGTPVREFTISVDARGQQNQLSPYPAVMTVSNPAPATLTGVTFIGGFSQIVGTYDTPDDNDFAGVIVSYSTDESAMPQDSNSTIIDVSASNNYIISSLGQGVTYYLFIAGYDQFGEDELNWSSQYTTATILIQSVDIDTAAITSDLIAAGAVGTTQIADSAITTPLIDTGAITSDLIAAGAVGTSQIADAAITSTQIADNAITTPAIAAGAITATTIASGAITADAIEAGAVTTSALAAGAVTAATIASGTITSTQIAANAITATQIAAGAITSGAIEAGAVTTSALAAGAVTADTIATNTITSAQIASETITGDQIAADTITTDKLNVSSLSAITATIGTLQTASSGARLVIQDNIISVYDSSGTLRVVLGDLS